MISTRYPAPLQSSASATAFAGASTFAIAGPVRLLGIQSDSPCDCTVFNDAGRTVAGFTNQRGRIFDIYSENNIFLVVNSPCPTPLTINYE